MSYTPQGPVDLLNRIGFTYKKTAEEPCKAGAQKQEKFVEELFKALRSIPKPSRYTSYPAMPSAIITRSCTMGDGYEDRQAFLPPYSPSLNLIERLWKMLRKKVINTGFYRTKEEFRRAVMNFFEHIAEYKEELKPLLTLNFRLVNSKTISL